MNIEGKRFLWKELGYNVSFGKVLLTMMGAILL